MRACVATWLELPRKQQSKASVQRLTNHKRPATHVRWVLRLYRALPDLPACTPPGATGRHAQTAQHMIGACRCELDCSLPRSTRRHAPQRLQPSGTCIQVLHMTLQASVQELYFHNYGTQKGSTAHLVLVGVMAPRKEALRTWFL